jgi:hypothetical protein
MDLRARDIVATLDHKPVSSLLDSCINFFIRLFLSSAGLAGMAKSIAVSIFPLTAASTHNLFGKHLE